ncbi:uncharacterized protein (DUF1800 family) [Deinobacterium chartae]|uniref:Uncharacterized protein (DUF1800 family) n=1 Tax=Deinobacterium chartae TaxID=521158 RepID=A0A841HWS6_9DEIO|nr:DUF1800 domain-containing protein [Deinobacterium chartae]MBB6097094.1 uncharacterized protein (DUF1800 family) [Deinobacterium chartae]
MTLRPYRGNYTPEDAAHLLRRAAFGAPAARIRELAELGPERALDALLSFDAHETEGNPFDPFDAATPAAAVRLTQARWLYEMVHSAAPLREKLALVWHNHFVVGVDKVRNASALAQYLAVLRGHGLDRFETLTLEVARTPAMLRYLDNDQNKKGRPNENFARELLELFTTGLGHYSETDVTESARAFTGWTFRGGRNQQQDVAEFVFNRKQHDDGPKTYLGHSGRFGGEDIVRLACAHPATAGFVAGKLWRAYVSDAPDPQGVRDLAAEFTRSGGELRATLRALLSSQAFYAPEHRRALVRAPIDTLVGTLRALETPALPEKRYLDFVTTLARLGQEPLRPPDVSGWDGGRDWINDGSLLGRMQLAAALTLGKHAVSVRGRLEDLSLALLGERSPALRPLLSPLKAPQQAYLMLVSPEAALV